MNKYQQYPFIVLWGKDTGSFSNYISQQLDKAIADKAPYNAIYKGSDGVWHVITDCNEDNRAGYILSMYKRAFELTHK